MPAPVIQTNPSHPARARRPRTRAAVAALLMVLAIGFAAWFPAPGHAGSAVEVTATISSTLNLSLSGCQSGVAGTTDLGMLITGVPAISSADCTVQFGSSSGTAMLRSYQRDGVGDAMKPFRVANTIGYWPFNGDGQSNTPNVTANEPFVRAGAPAQPTFAPGKAGYGDAMVFDGVDDYAQVSQND
jgi:hypothetical protein